MNSAVPAALRNPPGFEVDLGVLEAFERGLDPQHPERSRLPARILGYGEISTVFEIQTPGLRGLACKRLPIFHTAAELERYQTTYEDYNRLLSTKAGLSLPAYGYAAFAGTGGQPIFYILQAQLPAPAIANRTIHTLSHPAVLALFRHILAELCQVWQFNRSQGHLQLGIDGQASNWVIAGYEGGPDLPGEPLLLYVDTSTPLFRIDGAEQLDPELFLRSAPSFLAWLLRLLFLKDVVNRYYDFHLVAVDLVANFYKEQMPDLIPDLIAVANEFFAGRAAGLGISALSKKEIDSYYREDRLIWSLYLSMRKIDRFLHTRLWHRRYPYILPGPIKR